MIDWLSSYIGNRLLLDVGCGNGEVLSELNCKGIGIDPFIELEIDERMGLMNKGIHIMPMKVQECNSLIRGLKNKAVMMFARPCHSSFVEEGIDLAPKGMEIIYITKVSNVNLYNDLGKYDKKKKLIKHKGQ